jgi:PEP-CTERM motif
VHHEKGNKLMKIKSPFKLTLSLLAATSTMLIASASQAATFHVTVDTSSLGSNTSAPFSLDFQLNDGGVLGNNSATVSNFTYAGGSATGSATTLGGATGDISSIVTFNNSSFSQELYQAFTPGTTLDFDVTLTTDSDGVTPDAFAFAILDSGLLNIPTTGLGDSLLFVNLNSATPNLQFFSGTGAYATVTAVPEPTSTVALFGLGCVGLLAGKRKKALSK